MVETERQAPGFRVGEIVTANAGIQPFHPVQDQTVNRITGGKRQTAENVVIQVRERIGVVGHFIRRRQHFLRFIRMLTKRGADKNRGDIGSHRQQIINQLRHAFMIKTRERFKNIQPGRFPEIVHLCRFAVLNRQPAVSRQALQYFA